ncbi:MAG: hypothetical protein RLZZ336_303 [Cyanobacteriota bacterium]
MLSRRQLLAQGAGLLPAALLAGCSRGSGPGLLTVSGDLPKAWLSTLPRPWSLQEVEATGQILAALNQGRPNTGLVQLSDGWASSLERRQLQPFGAPELLARLAPDAAAISRLFGPSDQAPLAFPWAVSPWVLALRNRADLLDQARQSWDVLLDPRLKGALVLPSSPRISIALMQANPGRLRRLRSNALAYDDANGLNLLLRGKASAAVLPQQRLIPLLRQDPRLQVVLPASGAPLSWQLLLRPARNQAALPLAWLQQVLEPPLLPRLLAAGWVPPLPRATLQANLQQLPPAVAALLLPPEAVQQRCWSLPPLSPQQRLAWQTLWDASAP